MTHQHKNIDSELVTRIERFLRASGMSMTAFGMKVANDRRLVPDLREGRDMRTSKRARVVAFLDANESEQ